MKKIDFIEKREAMGRDENDITVKEYNELHKEELDARFEEECEIAETHFRETFGAQPQDGEAAWVSAFRDFYNTDLEAALSHYTEPAKNVFEKEKDPFKKRYNEKEYDKLSDSCRTIRLHLQK